MKPSAGRHKEHITFTTKDKAVHQKFLVNLL